LQQEGEVTNIIVALTATVAATITKKMTKNKLPKLPSFP
jgi:hypothetical protein